MAWLVRRGVRRGLAVAGVCLALIAIVAGFFAAAIPPLVQQAGSFIQQAPQYLRQAQDSNSWIGQLNQRFGLQDRLSQLLNSDGTAVFNGLLGAGAALLGALLSAVLTANATLVGQRQNDHITRLSETNYDQNEQVKRISAWAAILFAPTLVGGVHGMNFHNIPELHWQWGYPAALGLMGCSSPVLFVVFKRRGWL